MEAALEPGKKRHECFFVSKRESIYLGVDPKGDGIDASHPQEGGGHAPVQSPRSILPENEPLKKFMHGLFVLPHAVEQAVEGAPVGARWGRLYAHLHCVQRISSQHSGST